MEDRVSIKTAASELGMSVITLRGLMKQGKLDIGYALKKEGSKRWSFFVWRKPLDELKEKLGIERK